MTELFLNKKRGVWELKAGRAFCFNPWVVCCGVMLDRLNNGRKAGRTVESGRRDREKEN
ncbi:hypothetical protein Patl1_17743 [Pistacia atlantica]|uniref:Uncharacterized protein n=1 Tax=Pistacia atlantica TaxID=434234 RepID=A0ACC1C2R9_9ROSI|nr:hypothetical protein Patl1_17743 [Pistacia atlantica]